MSKSQSPLPAPQAPTVVATRAIVMLAALVGLPICALLNAPVRNSLNSLAARDSAASPNEERNGQEPPPSPLGETARPAPPSGGDPSFRWSAPPTTPMAGWVPERAAHDGVGAIGPASRGLEAAHPPGGVASAAVPASPAPRFGNPVDPGAPWPGANAVLTPPRAEEWAQAGAIREGPPGMLRDAPPRGAPFDPASAVNRQDFEPIETRLRALGATYYRLEFWQGEGTHFRFSCRVAIDSGNPTYTRPFEATDSSPLEAMRKVLRDIEQWRETRSAMGERR